MCLTCGCWEPDDDHGDPEYLTLSKFEKIAQKDDLTVEAAAKILQKTLRIAAKQRAKEGKP